MLFQALLSSPTERRRFNASETLALVAGALGDTSSYMQTIEPCPRDSFMGTPMMAWASAALNFEQGSMPANGDSFCASGLDAAAGADERVSAPPEDELLQEHSSNEKASAQEAGVIKMRLIFPPGRTADSKAVRCRICYLFWRSSLNITS